MYKTKINPEYLDSIRSFWWQKENDELIALMTIENMTLVYSPETKLVLDICNYKLLHFEEIEKAPKVIYEAKQKGLKTLAGQWEHLGWERSGKLIIIRMKNTVTGSVMTALPSKLKVFDIIGDVVKETGV